MKVAAVQRVVDDPENLALRPSLAFLRRDIIRVQLPSNPREGLSPAFPAADPSDHGRHSLSIGNLLPDASLGPRIPRADEHEFHLGGTNR